MRHVGVRRPVTPVFVAQDPVGCVWMPAPAVVGQRGAGVRSRRASDRTGSRRGPWRVSSGAGRAGRPSEHCGLRHGPGGSDRSRSDLQRAPEAPAPGLTVAAVARRLGRRPGDPAHLGPPLRPRPDRRTRPASTAATPRSTSPASTSCAGWSTPASPPADAARAALAADVEPARDRRPRRHRPGGRARSPRRSTSTSTRCSTSSTARHGGGDVIAAARRLARRSAASPAPR